MPGDRRAQNGGVTPGVRIEQLFRPHFRVAPRIGWPVEQPIRKARCVPEAMLHKRHSAQPSDASIPSAFPDFEVNVEAAISEAFIHGCCRAIWA
jgi:hypothetical protein